MCIYAYIYVYIKPETLFCSSSTSQHTYLGSVAKQTQSCDSPLNKLLAASLVIILHIIQSYGYIYIHIYILHVWVGKASGMFRCHIVPNAVNYMP